jgi:delta24-sterol reductase
MVQTKPNRPAVGEPNLESHHMKSNSTYQRKSKGFVDTSLQSFENRAEASKPQLSSEKPSLNPTTIIPSLLSFNGLFLLLLRVVFALMTPFSMIGYAGVTQFIQCVQWLSNHPSHGKWINPGLDMVADFATYHRGILVTLFVNPVSMVWEFTDFLRDLMWDLQMPAVGDVTLRKQLHQSRIAHVQHQINEALAQGATKLCTARPGYLAMSMKAGTYKKQWTGIDVHALRDIIEIDEAKEIVWVEPGYVV